MADLNAASLEDVKDWFRAHYGPNNAVLVLAGDIDLPTAKRQGRAMVRRHPARAGDGAAAAVPYARRAPVDKAMHDRVATSSDLRAIGSCPGVNDPDTNPLELAASILGGLGSSRLDNALVRKEKIAVSRLRRRPAVREDLRCSTSPPT